MLPSSTRIFEEPDAALLKVPAVRHVREHESVAWQHGPFLRDVGVKMVVGGKELRAYEKKKGKKKLKKGEVGELKFKEFDTVTFQEKGSKSKKSGKGGGKSVDESARISAITRFETPVDNAAPSRAARYALYTLKRTMGCGIAPTPGVNLYAANVIRFRWRPPLNWTEGKVERKAKEKEVPPGGEPASSYVVKFNDGERMACVLKMGNEHRGVGRAWCTFADWTR